MLTSQPDLAGAPYAVKFERPPDKGARGRVDIVITHNSLGRVLIEIKLDKELAIFPDEQPAIKVRCFLFVFCPVPVSAVRLCPSIPHSLISSNITVVVLCFFTCCCARCILLTHILHDTLTVFRKRSTQINNRRWKCSCSLGKSKSASAYRKCVEFGHLRFGSRKLVSDIWISRLASWPSTCGNLILDSIFGYKNAGASCCTSCYSSSYFLYLLHFVLC